VIDQEMLAQLASELVRLSVALLVYAENLRSSYREPAGRSRPGHRMIPNRAAVAPLRRIG